MRFRLIACALLLCSACSTATNSPAPSRHASPSPTSSTFSSARFTATIPRGWRDATGDPEAVASVGAAGQVLMLLTATSTSFNEHIDVSVAAQPVADDQLAGYLQSVAQSGATNLSAAQPFSLEDGTGIFITYNLTSTGGTLLKDQDMVINHNGDTFDIVLNTAAADFDAQVAALQGILESWKWTS